MGGKSKVRLLRSALLATLLAISLAWLGLFHAATAADTTSVSLAASPQTVARGQQFTASVVVAPATAIAGMQFDMTFDPSLAAVSEVEEGNLLSQGGASTFFNAGAVDNQAGSVSGVFGAIISPGQTVSTQGTFATLTLVANTEVGDCPLDLVNVVASDANGISVPLTVVDTTVTVEDNAPVLSTIGDKTVTEGSLLSFVVSASDADGDSLTYSASNLPSGATFEPGAGAFSWTPGYDQSGTYAGVHFEVSDGLITDSEDITITVGAVLSVPVLAYPADGKLTKDNTPWLDWSDVTDPSGVQYSLQVDDNADFSSPVVNKSGLTDSSRTIGRALADGLYHWRVRAVDGAGNMSDWTGSWSFAVDATAPPVPTLIYHANGRAFADSTPWLNWSDVADPSGVRYQVQVDDDADFSSPVVNRTQGSLFSSNTMTELPQGVYYWRVRSLDVLRNTSSWSGSWSFTITPPVPAPVYPDKWAKTNDNTPWLDWSDVASDSPVHYQVQVDNNADFSSPEVNEPWVNLSSTTLPVMPDGLYYWRVRSVNDAGIASNWSRARALRIDTTAPSAPALVYPVNGKVTNDNTPWLDWTDVTDATAVQYHLQVDDSADFSSTVVDISTGSWSSNTLPALADGVFYWRVCAVDAAGNSSDWTTAWCFTVVT